MASQQAQSGVREGMSVQPNVPLTGQPARSVDVGAQHRSPPRGTKRPSSRGNDADAPEGTLPDLTVPAVLDVVWGSLKTDDSNFSLLKGVPLHKCGQDCPPNCPLKGQLIPHCRDYHRHGVCPRTMLRALTKGKTPPCGFPHYADLGARGVILSADGRPLPGLTLKEEDVARVARAQFERIAASRAKKKDTQLRNAEASTFLYSVVAYDEHTRRERPPVGLAEMQLALHLHDDVKMMERPKKAQPPKIPRR